MIEPTEYPKAVKIGPRTFASVVHAYLASAKFLALEPSTQERYRRHLETAAHPELLGAMDVAIVRPKVIQDHLDGYADRPGTQTCVKVAIKSMEKWAVVRELLPFPISFGTEVVGGGGGHAPWSDDQVAIAEHHARPAIARIITLAANTGQRGSDLVKMRWSDLEKVENDQGVSRLGINVVQKKTGYKLWIPFTGAMEAAISTWDRQTGMILRRPDGDPWPDRMHMSTAWERERDKNPKLAPCRGMVLHGLRATAIVRLRRAGCPATLISDMVGLSVPMVERYCRLSSQKENAMAAIYYLDRTAADRVIHSNSERNARTGR